jgi:hypothetical protein
LVKTRAFLGFYAESILANPGGRAREVATRLGGARFVVAQVFMKTAMIVSVRMINVTVVRGAVIVIIAVVHRTTDTFTI